jgi:adenylyltransferase/sulfurtransferase
MHGPDPAVLRRRIATLEFELLDAKQQLSSVEQTVVGSNAAPVVQLSKGSTGALPVSAAGTAWTWPLEAEEYIRYGRQMVMPEVGLQGEKIHLYM